MQQWPCTQLAQVIKVILLHLLTGPVGPLQLAAAANVRLTKLPCEICADCLTAHNHMFWFVCYMVPLFTPQAQHLLLAAGIRTGDSSHSRMDHLCPHKQGMG